MHGSSSGSGSGSVYRCIVVSLYRFLVVADHEMVGRELPWRASVNSRVGVLEVGQEFITQRRSRTSLLPLTRSLAGGRIIDELIFLNCFPT